MSFEVDKPSMGGGSRGVTAQREPTHKSNTGITKNMPPEDSEEDFDFLEKQNEILPFLR